MTTAVPPVVLLLRESADSSLGRSCLSQYLAGLTLGDSLRSESLSYLRQDPSPLRRAWKFPEETSFRIWLFRDRSATSFFNRAFSFSRT